MRRRDFLGVLGAAAAGWPRATHAQQSSRPLVGFLGSLPAAAVQRHLASFRSVLKDAGYEEGKTVSIEYRWADGRYDRLPELAADLVRSRASVIVTVGGDPAALAAKGATSTIPIVFMVGRNPVHYGLVASLNRPGGNATGVNFFINETEAKRIELLREVVPAATSVAVLINPNSADAETQLREIQATANALMLRAEVVKVSNEDAIKTGFALSARIKFDAVLVTADPFLNARRDLIVSLAAQHAIPTIYPLRDFVEVGGLISYGASLTDAYRQIGVYTGKILQGTKPSELPVVQPTKIELVINLKTAKALGLTMPPSLLARADEVIE